MFEKNNESQMPLIDKTATFQQMTNNFSKACEYINSHLDIDNAIAKEDVLAMVKETESIVIEMYSKAKEIETQSTAVKMNDIKKEISEMNSKFVMLKSHFDKENKKYKINAMKEKKLNMKLYNNSNEDKMSFSIEKSFDLISSYLLQIQMIFSNLYRILSIDNNNKDISINVTESKEETAKKKFEFSSMLSLILCILSIIFFILYIYIYYL